MAFLPRNLRNAIGRWGAAALILGGWRTIRLRWNVVSTEADATGVFSAPLGSDFGRDGLLTGH